MTTREKWRAVGWAFLAYAVVIGLIAVAIVSSLN